MDMATVFQVKSEYAFKESEQFFTYEELSQRMNLHSKHDFVYYWRRDSRTVEGAHLKTARPISKKLKYYSVKYACVFGGQKFASRGHGERSSHNQTQRMNCPAFISLRASKCGQYLQVVQVCNQHNHEISENAIKRTPQYRKLTPQVKEEVLHMLSANIQRNEIIKYVQLRAGIELISKNFNNFMVELKSGKKYETNPAVFERIQRFLERNKSVLAVNACQQMSGGEEDALIEPPKSVLEPYVDIEERYASTMEVDAKMERTNENYVYVDGGCELDEVIESRQSTRCQEYEGTIMEEPQGEMWQISLENRIVVDGTPDDIIEVVQMPGYLETEQPTVQSQCVNCMKAKSAKSLRSEIKTLRQMKRRMIRETNALNRKKHKLLNHIKQLE